MCFLDYSIYTVIFQSNIHRAETLPSSKFNHLDFYKEVYYRELERRNSLNTEIALQGTILVAIISGIFFLLTNLKSDHEWLHILFSALVVLETIVGLIAAWLLMRSYYDFFKKGRTFTYLPAMKDVDAYFKQVDRNEFDSFLQDSFIEACDSHIAHNDHKTRLLTRSSRWITYLMLVGAIITIVFLGNYLFYNPNLKTTGNHDDQKSEYADTTAACTASATTNATASRPIGSTPATPSAGRARQQYPVPHKVVGAED